MRTTGNAELLFAVTTIPFPIPHSSHAMSIVTKTGDGGKTKLLFGEQVSKADPRMEACGTLDELNAFLGLARAFCDDAEINACLEGLQRESFIVGAELATPPDQSERLKQRVDAAMTAAVEARIAPIEAMPGLLDDWALPGATQAGAALDVARTVARRAERCAVRLADAGVLANPELPRYLNRISDLLWLLGRSYEISHGIDSALRGK